MKARDIAQCPCEWQDIRLPNPKNSFQGDSVDKSDLCLFGHHHLYGFTETEGLAKVPYFLEMKMVQNIPLL